MPTNYTPDTSTLPDGAAVSTLSDGDAVNRDNLMVEASPGGTKKLTLGLVADWVTSLWTSTESGKVAGYTGTIWTIASGTLETFLHSLADKAGKVDNANSWTATQNFQSLTSAILATLNGLRVDQTFELASTASPGTTSAATASYSVTDGPVLTFDGWHHAGGTLTLTLNSPGASSAKRYIVEVQFFPTTNGDSLIVKRADTTQIAALENAGWVRFRWDGTAWRAFGGTFNDPTNGSLVMEL